MKTSPSTDGFSLENHAARFIALALLAVLLLSALNRAHGQPAAKSAVDPAGVYALVSVDGKKVPCTIDHEGTAMAVQSGTFTIATNGQITSVMTFSVGDRKNLRSETRATYTQSGAELTMQWQNAGWTKGRVVGQTFTMTNENMAFVYKK